MYISAAGPTLRKLTRDDLEMLKVHKNNNQTYYHQSILLNDEDQDAWFEKISKDPSCLYFSVSVPQPKQKYCAFKHWSVGCLKLTNIHPIHRSAMIGQDVWECCQGNGYSSKLIGAGVEYALSVLNLHRVECEVIDYNTRSWRSYEERGFKLEGVKRDAVYKGGRYHDSRIYAFVKPPWSYV